MRLTCLGVTMSQRRRLWSLTQKLENLELTQDRKSSPASLEMHRSLVVFLTNPSISHQAGGFTSYFRVLEPPRIPPLGPLRPMYSHKPLLLSGPLAFPPIFIKPCSPPIRAPHVYRVRCSQKTFLRGSQVARPSTFKSLMVWL